MQPENTSPLSQEEKNQAALSILQPNRFIRPVISEGDQKEALGDIMMLFPNGKLYCVGYRRDFTRENPPSLFSHDVWIFDHINLFEDPTIPGRVDTSIETGHSIPVQMAELKIDLDKMKIELKDVENVVFARERELRRQERIRRGKPGDQQE